MKWPAFALESGVFAFQYRRDDPAGWYLLRGLLVAVDCTTAPSAGCPGGLEPFVVHCTGDHISYSNC